MRIEPDPGAPEIGSTADPVVAADRAKDAALHLQQIRKLCDDLQVLMEHLASQPDQGGPPLAHGAAAGAAPAADHAAGLLALRPEMIAADRHLLGQLYATIGELARLAAPADVTSIRLTQAFVRGDDTTQAPAYIVRGARRLRRWAWTSASFGLLIFAVTLLLLVHLDRGRHIVQHLKALDVDQTAAISDLIVAGTAAAAGSAATDPAGCQLTGRDAAGQQHYALCQRLLQVQHNLHIIHYQLQMWNAASDRLAMISPISWVTPHPVLPADVSVASWQSSELRTAILMTAMSDVVLPMLLGLLGACVYVYRELDNSIQTFTLAGREIIHGTLRMLLGGILGGLVGVLWSNGQVVDLEGEPLSLGALAFFVGFSVEVVFRIAEAAVQAVADRIGKPTR